MAPVLGPTLGGWITDNSSWRWIFLINVPVGIVHLLRGGAPGRGPALGEGAASTAACDYIGLALIALGLGCLQVMLDRGEDDDWFGSRFDPAVRAADRRSGLVGAVVLAATWTRQPVVDLRVLKDRNFAVGSLMIFGMAAMLYSSAVLIPQLAQSVLGYTATLAGCVLSPGAVLVVLLIPLVSRVTAAPGADALRSCCSASSAWRLALLYSSHLTPQIDFGTLALMRAGASLRAGLPVRADQHDRLFHPAAGAERRCRGAVRDVPQRRRLDRHFGGDGAGDQRTQADMAHLAAHLTPYSPGYLADLRSRTDALVALGNAPAEAATRASGMLFRALGQQAQVLAYSNVFMYCAVMALAAAPLALLFSAKRAAGGAGGH